MKIVVSDTTPLNYLILIGHVEILAGLFGRLVVPSAVIGEMQHPKAPNSVAAWANNPPPWVEVKEPKTDLGLEVVLGAGERAAICLAVELSSMILLDDKIARAAAKTCGIPVIGTIALLDLADSAGLLKFEQALTRLQTTTFHVEKAVVAVALAKVLARREMNQS